jgi:hypothetical protein
LKSETGNFVQRLGLAEEKALKKSMKAKSKEFVEKGVEYYAKV